uniref:Uncharacterized protein n=1 Tax=Haemonchus contortus TaxID=6289 RepID=A0A7I4YWE8_HAECO
MCVEEYVGRTRWPLRIRIKEHLDEPEKLRKFTLLRDQRMQHHPNEGVMVSVKILSREDNISARKTREALWIAAREPKITGRTNARRLQGARDRRVKIPKRD